MFTGELERHGDRFALWSSVIDEIGAVSVAEVGVWKGDFAATMLRQCSSISRYVMIDPWANLPDWNKPANVSEQRFDKIYAEAMDKTSFAAERIEVLRGRTRDVADTLDDGSLDVVYVDGDHTLRGITIDLIKMLPKVRPGGLLAGDDFTRSPWQHDASFEPTLVCPFAIYFAEAHDLPIYALPFKQFAIVNDPEAGFSFTDTTGRYTDISLNKLHPDAIPERKRSGLTT